MSATEAVDIAAFDPSRQRAEAVGARMRMRLADSLRYILEQVSGHLEVPDAQMASFLGRLAAGPVSPLSFGIYCDLVLAIDADAFDEAERLLRELASGENDPGGPRIVELLDPQHDPKSDRYRRLVDTDVTMPFTIYPPRPADAARARDLIGAALALLDSGNRDLAGEIRATLREIVLAAGSEDPQAVQFDGVSSFLLWGAVVLNVCAYKTALDMVQALAHESGHNLLFGLCADGPLHENGDVERYSSPLRIDPRPMDGIVHAAYVSARMHQAVQRLLDAGILDREQAAEARAGNHANAKRFAMGMETIRRHARLTELGRAVMRGADDYMAAYL